MQIIGGNKTGGWIFFDHLKELEAARTLPAAWNNEHVCAYTLCLYILCLYAHCLCIHIVCIHIVCVYILCVYTHCVHIYEKQKLKPGAFSDSVSFPSPPSRPLEQCPAPTSGSFLTQTPARSWFDCSTILSG